MNIGAIVNRNMPPEAWAQIEAIYHAALERAPAERAAFLAETCAGNTELRGEVESLLGQNSSAGILGGPGMLETGAQPGSRLGPYLIGEILGRGGMGQVFRARDTRLNRDVAIKVSIRPFDSRFQKEALAVAALNHPNVCTLYDVGPNYLVMEMIEGPTLADRIKSGPIPIDEAFRIATQIAEALEAAHEKGLVHRDLKPANIKLRPDGTVKVLDFGLARWSRATGDEQPTVSITAPGTILGTPAYMSPEQARGNPVDRRADVWAFGAILYEMLTGQAPFRGETITDTLAAVVRAEPDWSKLPPKARRIVQRCLEKDPSSRLRHVGDFALLLDEAQPHAHPARRLPWPTIAILIAVLAAAGLFVLWRQSRRQAPAAELHTIKFTFTPPEGLNRGSVRDIDTELSVSEDGRHIGYVVGANAQLMVRDIDREQARPVIGATNVFLAFWSPDDRFIAYADGHAGNVNLLRIPAEGGTPSVICKVRGQFKGGVWDPKGDTIVFADAEGMYSVPAAGGAPTTIVEHPHIEKPALLDLPDGRHAYVFQVMEPPVRGHKVQYMVAGEHTRHTILVSSSSNPYPAYSSTGHIIYVDGAGSSVAIWALPFSLATLKATGQAFPIAQHGTCPRLAGSGTLVYSDVPPNQLQLAWVDRGGNVVANIGKPQLYVGPVLSPDGRRIAVRTGESGFDLWTGETESGVLSRLTVDTPPYSVAWSPSGSEIAYCADYNGSHAILSKPADGAGNAKPLLTGLPVVGFLDWSPGQRYLMYSALSPQTQGDIFYRERRPDGSMGEQVAFLQTAFNEYMPQFSPDGHFVAYVSNESGRAEVYVRTFPGHEGKSRISPDGGISPRWRRDGKELFYVNGPKLMAAPVTAAAAFSAGPPVALFSKPLLASGEYDVAPDGKRFLVREGPVDAHPLAIHVVNNWFEEFRRAPGAAVR
jgi:serine/threonine protein kinase/Tol biopolymer transport system component